jgi:ATP-binding cassette subfamily C protein
VTQETFLYHTSVRDNLRWSRPEASDDEIWLALERAAAADFVRALPEGLDTVVGDRGALISGGERQRLSLARALLRRPRLLLLDEATGSLDAENEGRILEALNALRGTITIVLITHRLALTRAADMIHVIEEGRILESGAWQSLQQQRQGRFMTLLAGQGAQRSLEKEPLVVNR